MIGRIMNRWLLFFYLHDVMNRFTSRRLRWKFRRDQQGHEEFQQVTIGVAWGHSDADVWDWHMKVLATLPGDGWAMTACPPEVTELSGMGWR